MSDLNRRIELEALITERGGMIALNTKRVGRGESIAYDDDAFLEVAKKMMSLMDQEPAPAYTPEDVARLVGEARAIGDFLAREYGGRPVKRVKSLVAALVPFKEKQ
jgi:hypothetical protein